MFQDIKAWKSTWMINIKISKNQTRENLTILCFSQKFRNITKVEITKDIF